jgi:threonine dehydrogenase-like Zn-dependent dehydrogenase
VHYNEIHITGTFAATPHDFKKTLNLITTDAIKVEDLISHRFTLDNMLDAVEKAKNHEMIKGIVLF